MSKTQELFQLFEMMKLLLQERMNNDSLFKHKSGYYFGEDDDLYFELTSFNDPGSKKSLDIYVSIHNSASDTSLFEVNLCDTWFIITDFHNKNNTIMYERETFEIYKNEFLADELLFTLTYGKIIKYDWSWWYPDIIRYLQDILL